MYCPQKVSGSSPDLSIFALIGLFIAFFHLMELFYLTKEGCMSISTVFLFESEFESVLRT